MGILRAQPRAASRGKVSISKVLSLSVFYQVEVGMGGAARAEELEGTRSEAMVPATPLPTSRLRTPTARLERSDRQATI